MTEPHRHFIPAAGTDWLLPLYDPFQRWIVREEALKGPLVEQARIRPGQRVLDIGCGTGSLTLLLKRRAPGAEVIGLDPDPKALAIARHKGAKAGLDVRFEQGFSDELPFEDGSIDRVFSSLMFHHLTRDEKNATLREVRRVLGPEGSLHLLDFGPPRGRFARFLAHLVHRGEQLRDNLAEGRLPSFMVDAGLGGAEEVAHRNTIFGTVSYYRGGGASR